MKRLNLVQGSPEWHAHRSTARNASDVPVMMGLSKYKTRAQLVRERATGIVEEIDEKTQMLFDAGHRFEALARPHAEKIIGDELSPVTGVHNGYSASFDGIPFDNSTPFEHKSLNNALRELFKSTPDMTGADLDLMYQVQMEQQLMVCGGDRVLFMASSWDENDQLLEMYSCWYFPNPELRARIVAAWEQFEKDVASYTYESTPVEVVGNTPDQLPALLIEVTGAVTASNLSKFKETALAVIGAVNTDLKTDQDFADADKATKWCKDVEDRLEAAKNHALAQTSSIDELFKAIDTIKEEARQKRLALEKLVKTRKDGIRVEKVRDAMTKFAEHVTGLQIALPISNISLAMLIPPPDFAGAIKGLKTIDSLNTKLDVALANGKIDADRMAKDVRDKLAWCKENAAGHSALLPDLQQLIVKPFDDFKLVVATRIKEFHEREQEKLDAERARIEAEAKAKAEREAAATVAQPVVTSPAQAAAEVVTSAGQANAVLDNQSEIRAFLDSREWASEHKRNEARAICMEFVKFQQRNK